MIHQLKISPEFFEEVISGRKSFEIRFNDREFNVGDILALNEWEQTSSVGGHYTNRSCVVYVDYIFYGGTLGVEEDYVVMSIKPCIVRKVRTPESAEMYNCNNYSVPVLLFDSERQEEQLCEGV